MNNWNCILCTCMLINTCLCDKTYIVNVTNASSICLRFNIAKGLLKFSIFCTAFCFFKQVYIVFSGKIKNAFCYLHISSNDPRTSNHNLLLWSLSRSCQSLLRAVTHWWELSIIVKMTTLIFACFACSVIGCLIHSIGPCLPAFNVRYVDWQDSAECKR